MGSRVVLEALWDFYNTKHLRCPKVKNMAECCGVSPAHRSCISNTTCSCSPLKLLPQTELGGLAVMPPPHGAAERWPSQRGSHPWEGFFLWKINKFCPQISPGKCLPVIFVPSILGFTLPAPQAASAEEETCVCTLAFRNARRLRREGSRLHLLLVSNNCAREKAK